jgi:putative nucleotidyltransferase with HDIG domain
MALDPVAFRNKLLATGSIPTLPTIALSIAAMVKNPAVNAADVSKMIEEDQALTATILRLVNSAFYGFPNQIKNINHAIVILGFNKVRSVVLSATIVRNLRANDPPFDVAQLWEHSMTCAVASEVIGRVLRAKSADDAFVAGLLHDIGKVILANFFPAEFTRVLKTIKDERCLIKQAEEKTLGVHHGLYGKWLAEHWGFPEPLAEAVQFHHAPGSCRKHRELASIVHLGDILARGLGVGSGGDPGMPMVDETAWESLKLSEERLDRIVAETIDALTRAHAFFDMIRPESTDAAAQPSIA